ncbi:hypothetical protein Tco_0647602, partial [Tanacetum coccineum]
PSRAFYYRSTARMAVRTQPTLSPGYLAKLSKVMILSPSSFRKRYISSYETPSSSASPALSLTLPIRKRYYGTSDPILDTETKGDESEAEGTGSKSEESEDEGPGSKGEETAYEDQHQQEVLVEGTAMDEPMGLGYRTARRYALELAAGPVPSTFKDSTIYLDIEFDPLSRVPVQTLASPEWSSGSLLVSPASLSVPSPVALPVTTPATTIAADDDESLEVGAHLELHRILALEAWAGHTNAYRAALWQARYKDQREIHALRMHHAADQHEMQGLRERERERESSHT